MADDEALEREREERRKALRRGLKTTRGGFIAKLGDLLRGKKELDADLLGEIEELLLTADVGVQFTETLVSGLKKNLSGQELQDPDAVWAFLREQALAVLAPAGPAWDTSRRKPFVVMVIGVNGVGKTTTIAKLASRYVKAGQKVVLAAGDTFRAAAVRQLEMWGARVGAEVVKRDKAGADPSAVVFDAIERGVEVQADIVIADTAGRLHTKSPLMEELKKVNRVMGKALDGSPHEVLLVLDANTGQNANQQVKQFKEAMDLTGIVLTKLDGTAKGGVILGICAEHGIPIRFIGVGEKDDDLRQFDAEDFVDVLFERPEKSADTAA
jgi:fused signal recognition particle receptor